jgi:hypothetical protein
MSLFDVLNTDKDRQALDAVIDHAAQALTDKIVPAIQKAESAVISQAQAAISADLMTAIGALNATAAGIHAELAALRALLDRLDGASVTLKLGK